MIKIDIKLLSINEAFQGRRFKTNKYKNYEKELLWLLPKLEVEKDRKLKLRIEAGLSSRNADLDNICKPLQDILQKKYQFNDKWIYELEMKKVNVKKSEEYVKFDITLIT